MITALLVVVAAAAALIVVSLLRTSKRDRASGYAPQSYEARSLRGEL